MGGRVRYCIGHLAVFTVLEVNDLPRILGCQGLDSTVSVDWASWDMWVVILTVQTDLILTKPQVNVNIVWLGFTRARNWGLAWTNIRGASRIARALSRWAISGCCCVGREKLALSILLVLGLIHSDLDLVGLLDWLCEINDQIGINLVAIRRDTLFYAASLIDHLYSLLFDPSRACNRWFH